MFHLHYTASVPPVFVYDTPSLHQILAVVHLTIFDRRDYQVFITMVHRCLPVGSGKDAIICIDTVIVHVWQGTFSDICGLILRSDRLFFFSYRIRRVFQMSKVLADKSFLKESNWGIGLFEFNCDSVLGCFCLFLEHDQQSHLLAESCDVLASILHIKHLRVQRVLVLLLFLLPLA